MQTAIILLVVKPFSFDLYLVGVLVGMAVLSLFGIGVGALSFVLVFVSLCCFSLSLEEVDVASYSFGLVGSLSTIHDLESDAPV